MNTEEIRKAQTTVSAPVKSNVLCGQCHQLIGNTNHVCTPVVIKCYTEAEYNKLQQENKRITKENVALNSRLELMDKHLQQYREERDSWINAAVRLGRKRQQLQEELERLKKEAEPSENG